MSKNFKRVVACLCVALVFFVCAPGARATIIYYNFIGGYAPGQWDLEPDQGTVAFANSDTELDIIGPTGTFSTSYDQASVTASPLGPGPESGWYVNLQYAFNVGDAEDATASVYWTGIAGNNPMVLGSGGPGASDSGDLSFYMPAGGTLAFELDSGQTGIGKQPAELAITDFSYTVPDATPWIEASLLLPLLLRRFWPVASRQS